MNANFDVIIVGSGPAGVSAAFPLVENGIRVLMVDGGREVKVMPPEQPFLNARAKDVNQWKWLIGKNFHSLQKHDVVSPKIRVPTQMHVFEGFEVANQIETRNFVSLGSLAAGGLSNAWGCGVARLSESELSEFPFNASDIEQSYETVARRVGISGRHVDDLSDYFGLDEWSKPPIQMDPLHTSLFDKYINQSSRLASLGFSLGRSRSAVLSEDYAGRSACNNSGNCLLGCTRRALYSATEDLVKLQQYQNFYYESGFVVEDLLRSGNHWVINGVNHMSQERRKITSVKVLLAAGTLATTRLALKALKYMKPVPLLSSPTAAFLLWLPRKIGLPRTPSFGLGQLSFSLKIRDNISAYGSTFGTTGIPVTEFVRHLPLSRRYGVDILANLLSSCIVGNVFLPGELSISKATLSSEGSLRVDGGYSNLVPNLMAEAAMRLRKAYIKLGAILLPMSFTVGRPGGDIHYAGTLAMREIAKVGETNAYGELCGLEGVHVVDGACLPTLSEKPHTLTIMANADRIARLIAQSKFLKEIN